MKELLEKAIANLNEVDRRIAGRTPQERREIATDALFHEAVAAVEKVLEIARRLPE